MPRRNRTRRRKPVKKNMIQAAVSRMKASNIPFGQALKAIKEETNGKRSWSQ